MGLIRTIVRSWVLTVLLASGTVPAQSSGWIDADHVQLRLVAVRDALGGGVLDIGLQVRLDPGWKFYWRTPGDAGLPPTFDWSGSANLAEARVRWPAPRRYDQDGLVTYVYDDEVVLPIGVRASDPRSPLSVRLTLDYGVCKDICIPYQHALELDLPAGEEQPTAYADLIAGYAARVPGPPDSVGWRIQQVRADATDSRPALIVTVASAVPFRDPDLVVEAPAPLAFGPARVELADGGRTGRFRLPVLGKASGELPGTPITLTLMDGSRSAEIAVRIGH